MDKLRFGVIGTNFISDWMIKGGRLDSRFEVVAVCSRSRERGEAFALKHGIPQVFTSVEEMVRSPLVDAVYVASPNCCHHRQSIAAMKAGKHVLCEKPMAANAVEAAEMIAVAKDSGVALMEAMRVTLTPAFRAVSRNMTRIGTPRHYSASYCQYSSRYDRLKAGELPNAFNPAMSGGALMDLGCYAIYPMVALFGAPESTLASGTLLDSGVDGEGAALFAYPGLTGMVLYSKISNSGLPAEISGEKGRIVIDNISRMVNVTFVPHGTPMHGRGGDVCGEIVFASTEDENQYYYVMEEFISVVQSGRAESAINSHENSLITMRLIDRIRQQTGVAFT